MSDSRLFHARLRAFGARLCGSAIGCGLAAGFAMHLAATLVFSTAHALMACASLAALAGGAVAAALTQRQTSRGGALNAYVCWLAISAILMVQIAATTDVLSA